MILGTYRLIALGAVLGGCTVPSLAAAPPGMPVTVEPVSKSVASSTSESREAARSRRVELPFPIQFRSPEPSQSAPTRRADPGPHPFRETLFKRASVDASAGTRGRRLSRLGDFS